MSVATEKLSLVNSALLSLGHSRYATGTDFTADSSTDPIHALVYSELNNWITEVLKAVPWKCVSDEAELSTTATADDDSFDYIYTIPSDFVRLIGIPTFLGGYPRNINTFRDLYNIKKNSSGTWVFMCDFSAPQINYVYQALTNGDYYALFDSELRGAIIKKIASELCLLITANASLDAAWKTKYDDAIAAGIAANGIMGRGKEVREGGLLDVRGGF